MILILGPRFGGKADYTKAQFGWDDAALAAHALCHVQELAAGCANLPALADRLAQKEVLLFDETGSGVVPMDAAQRAAREAAGRLGCLLAARADRVVRVYYGLPSILKG